MKEFSDRTFHPLGCQRHKGPIIYCLLLIKAYPPSGESGTSATSVPSTATISEGKASWLPHVRLQGDGDEFTLGQSVVHGIRFDILNQAVAQPDRVKAIIRLVLRGDMQELLLL